MWKKLEGDEMLPEKAPEQKFEGWVILEQLGHKRLGGYVREETIAGRGFLRIDIPDEGEKMQATQFINPDTIYCITPVTEPMARAVALRNKPTPVERWELPDEPQKPQKKQLTMYDVDHDGWDDEEE